MPNRSSLAKALPLVLLALLLGMVGFTAVMGQDATTTLLPGQETPGQVSQLNIAPAFAYTAQGQEVITVVVESSSAEFAPALRVLSGGGQLLQDIPNPANAPRLEAVLQLPEAGQYVFQVQSANGQAGSFVITITDVEPIPEPLFVGDDLEIPFSPEGRIARYVFDSDEQETLRLVVETEQPIDAIVTLSNEDGEELASFSLRLTGGTINIPPGIGQFLLTIEYEGDDQEDVRVALLPPPAPETPDAQPTAAVTATPAATRIPLVPLPSTGACIVASFSGGTVNLRSGPSTTFNVIATLSANNIAQVIGRLPDNSWYQVNYNGIVAWVAGFVIRQGGECQNVPVVPAPGATPTPIPGALPDLSVGGITVTPAGPQANQDFAINVTVNNISPVPVNNVLVRLTFNAPGISISLPSSETNIAQIPANSAITVNFLGIRANNNGNVQVNVAIDPNNAIPESNEGNNTGQLSFTVGSSLPDLVVPSVNVETQTGSTQVRVRFNVRNQGASAASNFTVRVRFNNGSERNFNFDNINPGDTESRNFTIDLSSFGDYQVTVRADSGNNVNESNENNNERTESFTLRAEVTPEPTQEVTAEPTQEVTAEPTQEVTAEPTQEVTAEPTQEVTAEPTQEVTAEPTQEVTAEPTQEVTAEPTEEATAEPTAEVTPDPQPVLDTDGDGVLNPYDRCPNTPSGTLVSVNGCGDGETPSLPDSDGDGVVDDYDLCPGSEPGAIVLANGCLEGETPVQP